MPDNIYERIHQALTWKRIIAFNVVLFLVLIIPISVNLSQQDTENRSSAAEEAPIVTPPPNYPLGELKIDRVVSFFGKTGDTIVILGTNFGDYQWGSKVYVGNSEAPKDAIVRWSNNVLEVKIPETARTGQVFVVSNNKEARWEGNLLIYDPAHAAQIAMKKSSNTAGGISIINANGVVKGMFELSYVSEPLIISPADGINITSQATLADNLGKKLKVTFESSSPLTSTRTEIAKYSYPGIGIIEILRAELFDVNEKLYPTFSDPLSVKVTP